MHQSVDQGWIDLLGPDPADAPAFFREELAKKDRDVLSAFGQGPVGQGPVGQGP
jgi:hypothetical protein